MDKVGRRAWIATPLLLGLAGLPMLRATAIPLHQPISTIGILVLTVVALKSFKDRATSPARVAFQRPAQVRREIPFLVPEVMRESPSGSHPRL